jgi:hypothetical protein
VTRTTAGPFEPADDPAGVETAVRSCFARLGQSRFELTSLAWHNADGRFVPASLLNRVRREVVAAVESELTAARERRVADFRAEVCPSVPPPQPTRAFRWSIKVDRASMLDAFEPDDWRDVEEVIVDIARDHPGVLRDSVARLASQVGRDRIRFALPALTRQWEEKGLLHKIGALRADGWTKWEAANLSAWHYLGVDPDRPGGTDGTGDIDLSTDWSVYVINRLAAEQVLAMGATRFALSPEDGLANWRPLLAEFGRRAVLIVYQDTPQFLAESCAYANLIGGCPGKANCKFESMEMVSSHGERVTALDYHCRTIVLNDGPFCLSTRLADLAAAGAVALRADFVYRPYPADEVRRKWRLVRAGRPIRGATVANLDRGIL